MKLNKDKNKHIPATEESDGMKCSNCETRYERPHWQEVLCDKCFKEYLDKDELPPFIKASGVEL